MKKMVAVLVLAMALVAMSGCQLQGIEEVAKDANETIAYVLGFIALALATMGTGLSAAMGSAVGAVISFGLSILLTFLAVIVGG
ncbi:MAG: hypothetical protein H3C30_19530 [Candidatus Hydrogenedentes bacterium]|nr:hypothetical protein [Candidatus Hydrogenedentota bacterium]